MASPISAANAYANLARLTQAAAAPAQGSDDSGPSFGALVKQAMGSVLDTGRKSDAQSMALASGKSNLMDVVTAVAETDVAVSTLVSVRDRVVSAYQEIMRMSI